MADRARWTFGSLLIEGSVRMSCTPGIMPDQGTLIQPYNDTQPTSTKADLILEWGNTGTWTEVRRWADCLIQRVDQTRTPYRDTVYTITDRRWTWKNPFVHGSYNVRDEAGERIASTAKTPRELATILLIALGETGYDVSALPTDADLSPSVTWSYASAAVELQKLCDSLATEIHLLANDTVKLIVKGIGSLPPSTNLIDPVVTGIVAEPRPESILAYAGDTLFDSWFELEPCMPEIGGTLDNDADVKALDDHSLKPSAGWETVDVEKFNEIARIATDVDLVTEQEARRRQDHCKKYLWKMFRLKRFSGGATKPPGYRTDLDPDSNPYPSITDMKLVLPLESTRLQSGLDDAGKYRRLPAEIAGQFRSHESLGAGNVSLYGLWTYGFRLDIKNGYVFTSRPCYRITPVVHTFATNADKLAGTGYTYSLQDVEVQNLFFVSAADTLNTGIYRLTGIGPSTFTPAKQGNYPPILALRCGYGLRAELYGVRYHHAYTKTQTDPTVGAGQESVARTTTRRICIENYNDDYSDLTDLGAPFDNISTVEARLLAEIDEYEKKYAVDIAPQTGRFSVPYSQNTDGLVKQVTWEAGAETPFVQTVSVGFEHDIGQKPAEQKAREEIRRRIDKSEMERFDRMRPQINQQLEFQTEPITIIG